MIDHRRLSAARRLALTIALSLRVVAPAHASGDICEAEWRLDRGDAECQNVAALRPGNDTRVNILLLMAARGDLGRELFESVGKPTFTWVYLRDRLSPVKRAGADSFASGEGSRCLSDASGTAAFNGAVTAANGLSAEEKTALAAARAGFGDCGVDKSADVAIETAARAATSPAVKPFLSYLRGAGAFYAGRFDEAAKDFEALRSSADPWIAETADYMAARTQLNALQVKAFDSYGSFAGSDKIDKQEAERTTAAFERYLKDHPNGRYAASARGLLRRVDWLAGWTDKLAVRYAAMLAQPVTTRNTDILPLVEEIDSKLLPALHPDMTKDPLLLAVLDLKGMRKPKHKPIADLTHVDLEAQREAFAATPSLYEMLQAADAFYIDEDPSSVLKSVPDATGRRDGGPLWFSRQLLRGEALEAAGDRNARGFWKELYPGAVRPLDKATVELALALHDEKKGRLDDVFAPGSLVADPAMRIILLAHDAGPDLLRAQAHDPSSSALEREVALFYLLDKELMHGRYANFLTDIDAVPAGAPVVGGRYIDLASPNGQPPLGLFVRGDGAGETGCPALRITVADLVVEPASTRDRLCLAEFFRLNDLSGNPLNIPGGDGALGSGPAQPFPGEASTRDVTYKAIIADRTAPAADRAYALYRAVKCFESVGSNGCGPTEIAKSERKTWYYALKREYPSSRWAKELRYWW